MIMPNTAHAPITVQRHESLHQEPNNLFSNVNSALHHPHRSNDTIYGASVNSEPGPLHIPDRNVAQQLSSVGRLSSNQHGLPDLRHFDLGVAEGVDLDEWMYDLAPRPEFNDHSAFMMNLGAIGGNTTFDNMFTYTDLS